MVLIAGYFASLGVTVTYLVQGPVKQLYYSDGSRIFLQWVKMHKTTINITLFIIRSDPLQVILNVRKTTGILWSDEPRYYLSNPHIVFSTGWYSLKLKSWQGDNGTS